MLTIEIDGRTAIPVRALPFVTEGTFAPEDLVGLFYDPESHCDAEFREQAFFSWIDRNGGRGE